MGGGRYEIADMVAVARAAEKAGFDAICMPENAAIEEGWDAFTPLTAIALGTKKILLSTSIFSIYTRTPLLTIGALGEEREPRPLGQAEEPSTRDLRNERRHISRRARNDAAERERDAPRLPSVDREPERPRHIEHCVERLRLGDGREERLE